MKPLSILMFNQSWLADELREAGHRVLTCGLRTPHLEVCLSGSAVNAEELLQSLATEFSPDRIVWHDDSGIPWLIGLERVPIPKLFYSVDSHHFLDWHPKFASLFDAVLVAQYGHIPVFASECETVQWFPPWATRQMELSTERPIDVCFRGTLNSTLHPKRAAFFERLRALVDVDVATGDYTVSYPRSKIVLNQSVNNDLNFRTFEGMASGALLLTPADSMGLSEIFQAGIDLVTYEPNNSEDAAEKIRYYLSHEAERIKIAQSGYEKVMQFHHSRARASTLEEILQELSLTNRPLRAYHAAFLLLLSHMVRSRESGNIQDMMLVRGALDSLRLHPETDGALPERAVMVIILRCIEQFSEPFREELLLQMLTKAHQWFPDSKLLHIFLAVYAYRWGDVALAEQCAAVMESDAKTLSANYQQLLAIAREELMNE